MALLINNVNIKTKDGDTITTFWLHVSAQLTEKPSPKIVVQLVPFRSESNYDQGSSNLNLEDTRQGLSTDVPRAISNIVSNLTPVQYANVDMSLIHNRVKDILEQGDSYVNWNTLFGDLVWAGFGANTVTVELPV